MASFELFEILNVIFILILRIFNFAENDSI